jgi:murein DD-endopeptidase MepM/ murein hydrolase activator NlpD
VDQRYQGRRRAVSSPHGRFLALLLTAVVGAGVVVLATGAALPDQGTDTGLSMTSADSRTAALNHDLPVVALPAPKIWVLPIHSYTVTSYFGQRWGVLHSGVDLGAPTGTPFYAAAAGTVILARWNAGYGYNVMIDHGAGILSVYGHSSKLLVKEGQQVRAGQNIALVGDTGHSFGSHLHFEIRRDNRPIEPLVFMRSHGVDIVKHTEPD